MLTLRGSCTSLTALCSIFRTAPLHVSLSQRVPQKRETRSLQRCCLGQLAHLRFHTSPNELELQISWTLTLLSVDISQQVQSHYREESPRAWEDSLLIGCEVMFVNYKTGILNITYLPLFLLFHISVLLSTSSSDSSLGLLLLFSDIRIRSAAAAALNISWWAYCHLCRATLRNLPLIIIYSFCWAAAPAPQTVFSFCRWQWSTKVCQDLSFGSKGSSVIKAALHSCLQKAVLFIMTKVWLLQMYVWVKKVYFKQQMGLLGMNKGLQAC